VKDAADLMLEAWYWMPALFLFDLFVYHAVVRRLERRVTT
jgi:hypothetical protein